LRSCSLVEVMIAPLRPAGRHRQALNDPFTVSNPSHRFPPFLTGAPPPVGGWGDEFLAGGGLVSHNIEPVTDRSAYQVLTRPRHRKQMKKTSP
jgi:hypothetical protein